MTEKKLKGDAKWSAVAAAMTAQSSLITPATSAECKAYYSLVKQHIKLKKKRAARATGTGLQDLNRKNDEAAPTCTQQQQTQPRATTAALRVALNGLELQGVAVLQAVRMQLQIACKRCRTTAEATLSEEAPFSASCSKCCANLDLELKTQVCNAVSIVLEHSTCDGTPSYELIYFTVAQ